MYIRVIIDLGHPDTVFDDSPLNITLPTIFGTFDPFQIIVPPQVLKLLESRVDESDRIVLRDHRESYSRYVCLPEYFGQWSQPTRLSFEVRPMRAINSCPSVQRSFHALPSHYLT